MNDAIALIAGGFVGTLIGLGLGYLLIRFALHPHFHPGEKW